MIYMLHFAGLQEQENFLHYSVDKWEFLNKYNKQTK